MALAEFDDALAAARAGDRDGLAWIWRTWNANLTRYLAARGAHTAEDLAADVWIEAARGLTRFHGGERDFPRWLFTIARRRLIDELRRSERRGELVHDGVAASGVDDRDPETVVIQEDSVERAIALVRTLAPDQAEAVLLRVVGGLEVGEVAEIMGRSTGAVRVLTHRGLRRLGELTQGVTHAERSSIEGVL
jgi:RNA polymerase sigma-70 factor (ECF subfamily)